MLISVHIRDGEIEPVRDRLRNDPCWTRARRILDRCVVAGSLFEHIRPGAPALRPEQLAPLGHGASALAMVHAVEPTPAIEVMLRAFLLWTLEQKVMLLSGAFLQGQFLRGVVLALDAVGATLTAEQRGAILDHLILTTVEDPDPTAFVNNHPGGHVPMRRVLDMPGSGFHLADEHVNNWDILGAMGLL